MLLYILLEVPLKKINKFIFTKKNTEGIIENDDNKEENEKIENSKIDDEKDDGDDEILLAEI